MKLMLVLGRELTFAGSTLLNDPVAQELFSRNLEFFQEGLIIPDLEAASGDFVHRLEQYRERRGSSKLVELAGQLNNNIRRVIVFEPTDVSADYQRQLEAYTRTLADQGSSATGEQLQSIIEGLRSVPGPISLKQVSAIARRAPDPHSFKKMAEFLYCLTGADVVGADSLYSHHYKESQVQVGQLDHHSQANLEVMAADTLFSSLALDWRGLANLSPRSILRIRDDARIRYGVQAVERLVDDSRARIAKGDLTTADGDPLQAASADLRAHLAEACARELKREHGFILVSEAAFDNSGLPFSSLLRRGVAKLEGWLAHTKHLGAAAKPLTPLTTFVSVIRDELMHEKRKTK